MRRLLGIVALAGLVVGCESSATGPVEPSVSSGELRLSASSGGSGISVDPRGSARPKRLGVLGADNGS